MHAYAASQKKKRRVAVASSDLSTEVFNGSNVLVKRQLHCASARRVHTGFDPHMQTIELTMLMRGVSADDELA